MLRLHPIRRMVLAAAPLLAVALACAHPAYAQQTPDWIVSEVSDDVLVKLGDAPASSMAVGDRLSPGSKIVTPADGRTVLTRADTSMTVSPNSEIDLVSVVSSNAARTTIFQKIGAVLYKVEKQSDQHFEVETPYLAAVVKGTTFTVGVNDDAAITHVVEGAVEVTSLGSGQMQLVHPGQTATVSSANDMRLEMSHNIGRGTDQPSATAQQSTETQSNARIVNRTLGITNIDIAAVTDGLVGGKRERRDGQTSAKASDDDDSDGDVAAAGDIEPGDDVDESISESDFDVDDDKSSLDIDVDDSMSSLDIDVDGDDAFTGIDIDDGMPELDIDVSRDDMVLDIDIDDDDD